MSIEDRYLSGLIAVQYPDAPVEPSLDGMQLAAGPSDTVSDAGGGVRVGRAGVPYKPPSMRDITEPAGAMLDMGAATVKGAVQGFAGLPGDLEGIGRMVLGAMGVQAGEKTVLPTTDEVKAWLDTNVGKVGNGQNPYESIGEITAPGGQIKAAKAVGRGAKALAPKAAEMIVNATEKTGVPVRGLGIIQPGPALKAPAAKKAEEVIKGIDPEEQTVLFHSGDASIDAQLKTGIEPGFGDWLDEVLAGAVDDAETARMIKEQDPIAFYSEKPDWVAMKVARVLKKPVSEVTEADIREHGQLSVVVVDKNDRSIWRESGNGEADQFQGKGRYTMSELPFGVERGDVFTTDAFVPDVTLTGDDLIEFLKKNAPGTNNLKPAAKKEKN